MRDWTPRPLTRREQEGPLVLRGRNPIHVGLLSLFTLSALTFVIGGFGGGADAGMLGLGGVLVSFVGWMLAEPASWRVLKGRTRRRLAEELEGAGYTRATGDVWRAANGDHTLRWKPISLDSTGEVAVDLVVTRIGELPITLTFEAEGVAPPGVEINGAGKLETLFQTGDYAFDGVYGGLGPEPALRALLSPGVRAQMCAIPDPIHIRQGALRAELHGTPVMPGDPRARLPALQRLVVELRSAVPSEIAPRLEAHLADEARPLGRALLLRCLLHGLPGISDEKAEALLKTYGDEPWCALSLAIEGGDPPSIIDTLRALLAQWSPLSEEGVLYVPALLWEAVAKALEPREGEVALTEGRRALLEDMLGDAHLKQALVQRLLDLRPHYDDIAREALLSGGTAVACLSDVPRKGVPELIATGPRERAEPVLFRLMEIEQGTARSEAVIALGEIGDQQTLKKMERVLDGYVTQGFDLRQAMEIARKRIATRAAKARREATAEQGGMLTLTAEPEQGGRLTLTAPKGAMSPASEPEAGEGE